MSYVLVFSKTALEDIEKHKKSGDRPTLKKIEKLLMNLWNIQRQERENPNY